MSTERIGLMGGVEVLYCVKSALKCRQINWPEEIQLECVGVEISLSPTMSFVVICLYRKPSATIEFYEKLKLLNYCDSNKEIIIIGDFNVNWNDKKARKNLKPTRITSH